MKNNPANITKIYSRDLSLKLLPYLKLKEAIAIVGPRQVGKTTLLWLIFNQLSKRKKCCFLTFEKRADLEIFDNDIENFKKLFCLPYQVIFIDEFQYAKNGGQKLKYLFDTTGKKFIISGSSSLEIRDIGKYLVGRILTFHLNPFSFSEFLRAREKSLFLLVQPGFELFRNILDGSLSFPKEPLKSETLKSKILVLLEEYFVFGGYPRVIIAKTNEEKKIVLASILDNYLLREIKSLLHLASENELLTLTRFLALQIGNLISYNELASSTNLSFQNLKKHLRILQNTFILDLIHPYYQNRRTELVKNPKVYFLDNGFRNKIIDNFSPPSGRTDAGLLAENYVFNSLKYFREIPRVNFWRTKAQAEVDFIVEEEGHLLPIEVKYTFSPKPTIGKSLYSFIRKYSPKNAIVATRSTFSFKRVEKTKIFYLPLYYFG